MVNGKTRKLRDKEYMPEVMHQHVTDFMSKHRDEPFYIYYSLSHVHAKSCPRRTARRTARILCR